jgi:hypothetical protein
VLRSREHLRALDERLGAAQVQIRARRGDAARLQRYARGWVVWYEAWHGVFSAMPRGVPDPATQAVTAADIAVLAWLIHAKEGDVRHQRPPRPALASVIADSRVVEGCWS